MSYYRALSLTSSLLIIIAFNCVELFGAQEKDTSQMQRTQVSENIDTLLTTQNEPTEKSEPKGSSISKFLLDPTIFAAIIQVVVLICITFGAGIWLHKKQMLWNYEHVTSHIRLQWKYDFHKALNQYAPKIVLLLGRYAGDLKFAQLKKDSPMSKSRLIFFLTRLNWN